MKQRSHVVLSPANLKHSLNGKDLPALKPNRGIPTPSIRQVNNQMNSVKHLPEIKTLATQRVPDGGKQGFVNTFDDKPVNGYNTNRVNTVNTNTEVTEHRISNYNSSKEPHVPHSHVAAKNSSWG